MRPIAIAATLAASLILGAGSAQASVITISVTGNLTTGFDHDNFLGAGVGSLIGDSATFSYRINTATLGASFSTTPEDKTWLYSDDPTTSGDLGVVTSLTPIGISDTITMFGNSYTTGTDRHFLVLEKGFNNIPAIVNEDEVYISADIGVLSLTPSQRDYVALQLFTENGNSFVPSLDPNDLTQLKLPHCNVDQGDSLTALFRHFTGLFSPNGNPVFDTGSIDLCSGGKLTVTVNTPEPITIALFGAGLAGAAAMRRRRKNIA